MESLGFSDPRRISALPLRPSWPPEEAMNGGAKVFDLAKTLIAIWNAWADCVEKVFQQIGKQVEGLEVSDGNYISFVRMFASHPARPTPRPLQNITEHDDDLMRTMPHRYLAHLQSLWTAYADRLETTYIGMTAALGRCNLLASPFESTSSRGRLHAILRSMLGPERLFQGLVDTRAPEAMAVAGTSLQGPSISHIDQMVSGIEHMNLYGAPGMHEEEIDGLVVLLRKIWKPWGQSHNLTR